MGQPVCNDVTPSRSESYGGPSKGSIRDNIGSKPKVRTRLDKPKDLKKECGIKAISLFLGDTFIPSQMKTEFEFLRDRSLCGGLTCKDLGNIMRDKGFSTDCRYCSQVRTYEGFPLPSFVGGLIALKFKDSKVSHWVAWRDGRILLNHEDVALDVNDLYEYYPDFDGFGHRVALMDNNKRMSMNDIELIKATYAVKCQKTNCRQCFRNGSCVDNKTNEAIGYSFECKD
jgi:hypothetical protein